MEDSQINSKVFSVRIVSIDYYMAPPISDLDISYSTFQGGNVKEVPVIRVYGSTPAGQKACVHIHRALPYLYIPCSDIPLQSNIEGSAYENAICLAVEKALKLKGHCGSKRQHVHGCTLVRARKIYGYHSSEDLFVKIYLYYPHDVSRAANLLLGGAVFEKSLQPYESHIPFLLQFLVDYNLYGMGHMHLVKMKFRHPVVDNHLLKNADHISPEAVDCRSSDSQADATGGSGSLVWRPSTIPDDWLWQSPAEHGDLSNQVINTAKRQSTCELEGDTTVDDILNQQFKMYTSLSQTSSDVKMVQSLVPIWEEEFERSGVHEADILGNPDKPLPQDVLKTLSNGVEYEHMLNELHSKTESTLLATSEEYVRSMVPAQGLIEEGSLMGIGIGNLEQSLRPSEAINTTQSMVSQNLVPGEREVHEMVTLQVTEGLEPKVADSEDMALLKWLASSQAAEDVNSDDELHGETILNPLLPAATIHKVLEKANTEYENESQQECQDILDSIEDVLNSDDKKDKASSSSQEKLPQALSDKIIPQLDGADDHQPSTPPANSSNIEMGVKMVTTKSHTLPHSSSSFDNKRKRRKLRLGSLPFSGVQQMNDDIPSGSGSMNVSDKCSIQSKENELIHSSITREAQNCSYPSTKSTDDGGCSRTDSRTLLGCSVRDLMRKKRCFRVESSDCGRSEIEEIYEKEKSDWSADKTCPKLRDNDDFFLDGKLAQSVDSCSSSFYNCNEKEKKLLEGDRAGKFGDSLGICGDVTYGMVSQNMEGIDCPTVTHVEKVGNIEKYTSSPVELKSAFGCVEERETSGYIGMTFHKKPPIFNWKNGTSEHATFSPELSNHSSFEDGSDDEGKSVQSEGPEDVLPFFKDSCEEGSKQSHGFCDFSQDFSMGVPTNYQNDGSYTYLLTPAISPPAVDSVLEWLTLKHKDHDTKKFLPGFSHGFALEAIGNHLDEENHRNVDIEGGPVRDELETCQDVRSRMHAKAVSKFSQDLSQISGPSGQSKATPLSQTGFRDPASLGAGQQLTLISTEVQAESRGDLRPDPKHDAINIIVLAVQNDNSSSVDIHVLLRGANEACGRNFDAICGCNVLVYPEERDLLDQLISIMRSVDPDILMGWDVQGSSLGFLAERAAHLGVSLLNKISRTPSEVKTTANKNTDALEKGSTDGVSSESSIAGTNVHADKIIEDEWGRTHASGVHVGGRIVLNVWRLMRSEVKLYMYTFEAVVEAVLRRKVPLIHWKILNKWFSSGPGRARFRCIDYMVERTKLNLELVNQLDLINRTSELARVFGIDFFSVLSRGSQYRVESMLARLAHLQNYVLISPGYQQVASQPAMECLPLVMEPESGFYSDPVIVLDFQSLYPSMIIAYNLCFSTCLGNVTPSKAHTLGVCSYSPDPHILKDLSPEILVTPNGVIYVPSKVRKGVLPRLLEEILSTRIMVKKAMKKLAPSQKILYRIFNARQLALKLIANVTYGYTAAGFSGRMPCAELADSIVQCGRRTLEHAISIVNSHDQWNARVIYGDTDSMFVLLKGRTLKEAFDIGHDIASTITAINPNPVTLKMEKVYQSCFLLTKKRYVGYSYESLDQLQPIFDAKGIETVRRDTCGAVAKIMEKSLKTFFEHHDISKVRSYLQRQWSRILLGRVSLQDFVFAKEVRLGTYSTTSSSSLPPAAIVASKAMRADPRAEPRYAERVPYVVVHGEPGARLVDMVVDPHELLAIDSPYRLNDLYYITKQIIPALQRVFGLVGADLSQWFQEMPRSFRSAPTKHHFNGGNSLRARIDYYYTSRHCVLCGEITQTANRLCEKCSKEGTLTAAAMIGRSSKLERDIQHLVAICRHCGGGDWIVESGVKCTSLACSVYYERRKVQKELRACTAIATEAGFYPKCMVEWF